MKRDERLTVGRILVVDDQPANVEVLARILKREGYRNVKSTNDPREALPLFTQFPPDLILLDLVMPHLDGVAVIELLRPHIPASAYLPILVLTADSTAEAKRRALSAGAKDFLAKPFDRTEVLLRIQNLLETRLLYRQLQGVNDTLEDEVAKRRASSRTPGTRPFSGWPWPPSAGTMTQASTSGEWGRCRRSLRRPWSSPEARSSSSGEPLLSMTSAR